jgi:hypothetical protein
MTTGPFSHDRDLEPGIRGPDASPRWEYLIVALPEFPPPTHAPGASDAIRQQNEEGDRGWEAVTMTALADGSITVLFKRPRGTP